MSTHTSTGRQCTESSAASICTDSETAWQLVIEQGYHCDGGYIACPQLAGTPKPSPPMPQLLTMHAYRVQGGDRSWWSDISNANVADADGEACYLANVDVSTVYPADALIGRYLIEIFNTTAPYAECPECTSKPCSKVARES